LIGNVNEATRGTRFQQATELRCILPHHERALERRLQAAAAPFAFDRLLPPEGGVPVQGFNARVFLGRILAPALPLGEGESKPALLLKTGAFFALFSC
jgi:hypothetical protein